MEIYAFTTSLMSPEGVAFTGVLKVGKTVKWASRRANYVSDNKRRDWHMDLPADSHVVRVPVNGPAEADVAESLVKMTLRRIWKLEVVPGRRDFFAAADLAAVTALLYDAASHANAVVGEFLGDYV